MQSFGVYHSSTRQTLVHSLKGELSQVVGTGSAGNREIFSYKTGSEAVYTSEFAARHSLSPAHTSALATLYSLSPASTPYGAHSTSPLLRESCFATSMSPHNVPIRHQSLEQNVTTSWGDQKAAAACKESHSLAPQKHLRPEATAPNEIKPRIYFKSSHHDPYYGFTHYSPHPVTYLGEKYPTSQHLFQAIQFKSNEPALAEHIRTCSADPKVALSESQRLARFKGGLITNLLFTVLFIKFVQHNELRKKLLDTGDAQLFYHAESHEHSSAFTAETEENKLGKALERLRSLLRPMTSYARQIRWQESQFLGMVLTDFLHNSGDGWQNAGELVPRQTEFTRPWQTAGVVVIEGPPRPLPIPSKPELRIFD